jgi:outer membrane protein TolC
LGITLSLPIFSRNRGPIAVERDTRDALYAEYQQRVNTAESDIRRILAEQRLNRRQLLGVDQGLADLSRAAVKTESAFQARNIDALAFATLQTALLTKKIERIDLEQAILEQRVALQTLAGGDVPVRRVQ